MMLRKLLLLALVTAVASEAAFQAMAFLGWLPGLNLAARVPWGRVYWTIEGFGNSVANRFGWYAPEFELAAGSRRIALVGDSYVEGLQVQPEETLGAVLQRRFAEASSPGEPPVEVLSLGLSGYGPAQYVDIVDFAMETFSPQEVVVFVTLLNDFTDVVPSGLQPPPSEYAYYVLDEQRRLVLHPDSAPAVRAFRERLRRHAQGVLPNLPATLASHWLVPQLVATVAHAGEHAGSAPQRAVGPEPAGSPEPDAGPWFIGPRRAQVFRAQRSETMRDAFEIAFRLLLAARDRVAAGGATFRIATAPHFPGPFYAAPGDDWSPEIGGYDLLLPEREVAELARREGIPMAPLGEAALRAGLSRREVKALYYSDGVGHFSPAGHAWFTGALYRAFYER
jgi:hypothetical protein